jgi:hypothetical protein
MFSVTGSPFGAVAPQIFSNHIRYGRVSALVHACQAGTDKVLVTAQPARHEEDELALYIVDMKAHVMSDALRTSVLVIFWGMHVLYE